MNLLSSLLAGDVDMNFEYVASVVITGITVVFIGLVLLVVILLLFGLISKVRRKSADKKAELKNTVKNSDASMPKVETIKPTLEIEDNIEEEIVAVITAAIAHMSEKSGKRLALKSIKTAKPQRTAWAAAGLMDNTRPF